MLNYLLHLNYTTNIMPINNVPSAFMSMSCMNNVNDTKQLVIPVITFTDTILDTDTRYSNIQIVNSKLITNGNTADTHFSKARHLLALSKGTTR